MNKFEEEMKCSCLLWLFASDRERKFVSGESSEVK